MTWQNIDTDLLEMFGEASRARGHVQRTENQRASASRSYDFGELFTGFGIRTSKKTKAAERREFKLLYLRKWYREAKADLEKLARIHASRRKAKKVFREKLKTDAKLREGVRQYMRGWLTRNKEQTRETKREWTRRNAERVNAKRRAATEARKAAGTTAKRKPLTAAQRARANERNRAWYARDIEAKRARRCELYQSNLETNRARKREDARRRYAIKKKPAQWSLRAKAMAHGINPGTVYRRLRRGWDIERALSVLVSNHNERRAA